MQAPDSGTYPLDLLINFSNTLQSQKYTILVHYIFPSHAYVRMPLNASSINFTLNPNPATGEVVISLSSNINSTTEIYDLLGSLVFQKVVRGSWLWNRESSSGELVASGEYIVRVLQTNEKGELVTASKRLMLLR